MSDANGVYVMVAMVPLGLTVAAAIGAGVRSRTIPLDGWLIGSLTLLGGAQVHDICWPASYGQAVANSDLVRLASTALLALGGVLALRRVAAERANHLATERANVARLHDVATRTTDYIAMIVHELGSPIAAIRAYTEILTPSELDTETRHRAIGAIQAETRLLDTLVGDARLMTAVERDEFAVFPFPIRADLLLADAGAFARTLPGHHPFAYAGGVYDRILADPDRLGQVLRNLILNATKHTPPGTPIELRARRVGDRLLIDVADQGPGIAPEDQERIFEKFQRGSGELPPGLGLGLYVSRRLVEAHGGSLTVVSRPGRGTVFTVELGVVG